MIIKESVRLYRHDVEAWTGPYFVLYVDGHLLDKANREDLRLGIAVGHYIDRETRLDDDHLVNPDGKSGSFDYKTFGCGLIIEDINQIAPSCRVSLDKIVKCRKIETRDWLNRYNMSSHTLFKEYSKHFYDFVMSWCKDSPINVSETVVKLILSNWSAK
jgi:hypothetical protein